MENTNEESPSPPIKATPLFLPSLKILRVTLCRAHLKIALFGSSFVVSPENCSVPKQMGFYNCHCCKFSHKMGGVVILITFFHFLSQLPPTARRCSYKAVSILRRMHKTESCRVNTAKEPSSSTEIHIHQAGS